MPHTSDIAPDDLTIHSLFEDFFEVPDFQREYVWEEDEVERFLEDIFDEFKTDKKRSYFIGTIVCTEKDGIYQLIDGQQRLTTAYILLCCIRDRLETNGWDSIDSLKTQISSTRVDEDGKNRFRFRLELQYEDSGTILEQIARGEPLQQAEETLSIRNIKAAKATTNGFLDRTLPSGEDQLRQFYSYFTNKVQLIRITASDISRALRIFETINDRGVGLDAMDLLKNLLFIHTSTDEFEKLKKIWKGLSNKLFEAKERPLRFLRYYLFSAQRIPQLNEDKIYSWLSEHKSECAIDSDPIGFAEQLSAAATAYTQFSKGKKLDGSESRYLANLKMLSGSARQHLILLMAARQMNSDCFDVLCKEIEDLFFTYIVTEQVTRDFETKFAEWAPQLLTVDCMESLSKFVEEKFEPEKKRLATRFALAFKEMDVRKLQTYRSRYVLAKLGQYLDENAWGKDKAYTDLSLYSSKKNIEIEHILSQNLNSSNAKTFWASVVEQEPELADMEPHKKEETLNSYVHNIANITLLEKPINASIKDKSFKDKKLGYEQSNFLMTSSIAKKPVIGKNTSVDKVAKYLMQFDDWDLSAFRSRRATLLQIAQATWNVPLAAAEQKAV
jgi:hypothetical protein